MCDGKMFPSSIYVFLLLDNLLLCLNFKNLKYLTSLNGILEWTDIRYFGIDKVNLQLLKKKISSQNTHLIIDFLLSENLPI